MREIVRHFGLPEVIISDRDSKWTSNLWTELTRLMDVKRDLSTARHQQTDGKCERAIKTVKSMLKPYLKYTGENWVDLLHALEFSFNSTPNRSGISPFEIDRGRNPRPCDIPADEKVKTKGLTPFDKKYLELMQEGMKAIALIVQAELKRNQDKAAAYYDKKKNAETFKKGDQVLLNRKDLDLPGITLLNEKLADHWVGPFKVKKGGKNPDTYELELTTQFKSMYPVFHVGILKRYHPPESSALRQKRKKVDAVIVDGEEEWPIDCILNERLSRGKKQFLVRWKGYGDEDNQWINESYLLETEALKRYRERLPATLSKTRAKESKRRRRT